LYGVAGVKVVQDATIQSPIYVQQPIGIDWEQKKSYPLIKIMFDIPLQKKNV